MGDGDETAPMGEPPEKDPPQKYDQDFFLVLASKGKDAWNAWRHDPANEGVRVTFADVDFSEVPRDQLDFAGFPFGDFADFSHCTWRGVERKEIENDTIAFRPGRACFTGAAFGVGARFTGAAFGGEAYFNRSFFNGLVDFSGRPPAYERDVGWQRNRFLIISFANARFDGEAVFSGRSFEREAGILPMWRLLALDRSHGHLLGACRLWP